MDVDPVEKRAGDAAHIILNFARSAAAFTGPFSIRSWIHRGDEHELRWERHGAGGARDSDAAFFERLAKSFENVAFEFGECVEEQDAVVRERNFAGRGIHVPAEQA